MLWSSIWSLFGAGVFAYSSIYCLLLCLLDCDIQLAFYEAFGKGIRRLKGQVVFITGASSGIGEYTAYALAKHGVKLVLTARRLAELERVKRKCLELSKGLLNESDVLIFEMDMLKINSHKKYFDKAVEHFGAVDVLLNNAGRSQRAAWENIDLMVDKELFDLNVFSVINFTRVALKYFKQQGQGHIAVTSSLAGVLGAPLSSSYTGSKHAIHGYMDALRYEKMEENITVTLLCPGPVETNIITESFTEVAGEKFSERGDNLKRMTAERCGLLCAIAIANKQSEAWMSNFPLILAAYGGVYSPILFNLIVRIIGPTKFYKLRDARLKCPAEESKTK